MVALAGGPPEQKQNSRKDTVPLRVVVPLRVPVAVPLELPPLRQTVAVAQQRDLLHHPRHYLRAWPVVAFLRPLVLMAVATRLPVAFLRPVVAVALLAIVAPTFPKVGLVEALEHMVGRVTRVVGRYPVPRKPRPFLLPFRVPRAGPVVLDVPVCRIDEGPLFFETVWCRWGKFFRISESCSGHGYRYDRRYSSRS